MREIIYIQAGNVANHIGTHFWNTQESYFTYEEGEDPFVNHDISFREGQTLKGESTFCPRLLLFDHRANFGALSSGLYGESENADDVAEELTSQWNGSVVEYRQDEIPKSKYQTKLEAEEGEDVDIENQEEDEDMTGGQVRFWSDYTRVFFHPRTCQRLPDLVDYESAEGDWILGRDTFTRYDEGVQITNDNTTFGSFTHSFLTSFRDEFPKISSLTIPILSSSVPGIIDFDDLKGIRKAMNDALFLRGMNDLSTLTAPIQNPSLWKVGDWCDELKLDVQNLYHTSAIISTHIESATLPIRLKSAPDDLSSLLSALNWRGDTKYAHLSGIFPLPMASSTSIWEKKLFDLSAFIQQLLTSSLHSQPRTSIFARVDICRGINGSQKGVYDQWISDLQPVPKTVHAPALPIPTSFPPFFITPPPHPSPTVKLLSCLTTTSHTSALFSNYARLVDETMRRHGDVIDRMGLEMDDVKDLQDELRTIEDGFREDSVEAVGIADEEEEMGEDEEY
ncbi:Misato segment II tubulin-like domain-containing protein [Abortiporus biennis]|nr:Misato segment II tubulin-like domain-containing protein [Abortiporus biennis]